MGRRGSRSQRRTPTTACDRTRRTCWRRCRSGGFVEKAALFEQAKQGALFFVERVRVLADVLFELGLGLFDADAAQVGLEYGRMHIALPADGRRVAELGRDGLDGRNDVLLGLALVF